MAKTNHLGVLQNTQRFISRSVFKAQYLPSVCNSTSTVLAAAVTPSPTTVAVVATQPPRSYGDEEATLTRSTSGANASTSKGKDSPTTTDDTCSTDNGTPDGLPSGTDSTTYRVTTESGSEALCSPSSTVDDTVRALSTSSSNEALTTAPSPGRRLNSRITPAKTNAVTEQQTPMK